MSVRITAERSKGIALLHACPLEMTGRPLPTVILFHSFGVSKEVVSFLGYMLAAAGMRCLMPEAPFHGERFDGDAVLRQRAFWNICTTYVDEAEALRDAFRPLIADPDRIGVTGTSMGGFAAIAATARYDWVAATASFMGSAYFHRSSRALFPPLGSYDVNTADAHDSAMRTIPDPSATLCRLADRPIWLWHGQRDDVVHFSNALDLQADLRAMDGAGRLEVSLDPTGSHRVTDTAARSGVAFLSRELDVGSRSS
ncbi:esterase [Falsirhodobacter sp. 1013]|uniref:esterase n=1 Tax=Falsirhodobacter sp. 1013 TaxID=3417566 RepID=UPI003EBDEEBB